MSAPRSGPATADLFRHAALGDARAWDALVERFTPLLWSVAREFRLAPADAADVVQTAWLRLLEQLDAVQDPERVGGWLATTVRRECLRHVSRTRRERPGAVDVSGDPAADVAATSGNLLAAPQPALDAALLLAERDETIRQAFAALPDRCRHLLRLVVADPPLTYAEVAATMDMPIGSIGPNRGRCLARLRSLLAEAGISARPGGSVQGTR